MSGASSGDIRLDNPQHGTGGSSCVAGVSTMAAGTLSTNSGPPSLADVGLSAWLDVVLTISSSFLVIEVIILFSGACRSYPYGIQRMQRMLYVHGFFGF
jgi:hypothetical protein